MGKKTSRALVCLFVCFEFVVDGWLLLFAFVLNFIVHCLLRFDNTIPNSSNPQLRSVSKKTSRAGSRVKRVVDPAAQAKVDDLNR